MSDDVTAPADDRPAFRRGVVRPYQCLSEGFQRIKGQYWLFFGITVVGMLILSVPFVNLFLAGPIMCGIYYCLIRYFRGRSVKFEMLFKGFDDFAQGLIATLIIVGVTLAIFIPLYVLFFVGIFASMPKPAPGGPAGPPPAPGGRFFATIGAFYFAILALVVVLQVFFFFVYQLIADRKLTAVQAIGTSVRAGMGNFGGLLGLVLLIFLLNLAGSLACCVGQLFVIPIHYAAYAVAYRHVFELETEEPPPVQDYGDPDVRALPPDPGPP